MSNPEPTIRINVDLSNPGQFFACCGLFELADRLWPGTEGWFEGQSFCLLTDDRTKTLSDLLAEARDMTFPVDDEEEDDGEESDDKGDDLLVEPIELKWKNTKQAILLDWWTEKSIKPWAGSMKGHLILRAMLRAIDSGHCTPFDDLRAVFDPPKLSIPSDDGKQPRATKSKKREPFYFDPRRGNKSHPLDSGFSPDTHEMHSECSPALEALCFIGLQRARPAPTGTPNQSRYTVWTKHIPANLVGAVVCGIVPLPGSINYVFNNYFRTDQHKHKTFSQATRERSNHV